MWNFGSNFWGAIMLWSSEFIKPEFEQSIFTKHEMLNITEKWIDSGNEFKHFEGFWTKIEHFHTTPTSIIFTNFPHHLQNLLCSDFEKKDSCCMTKNMLISLFSFLLLISLTVSSFWTQTSLKFFPRYHFTFRLLFLKHLLKPANQTSWNKN